MPEAPVALLRHKRENKRMNPNKLSAVEAFATKLR